MHIRSFKYFIFCCLVVIQLQATIIRVPSDYGSIQGAIASTMRGDTLIIEPGQYFTSFNTFENARGIVISSEIMFNQNPILIQNTILRASGSSNSSVISLIGDETSPLDSSLKIIGFTIVGGSSVSPGGGIHLRYANPVIEDCIIQDNYCYAYNFSGGGMSCEYSNPIIRRTSIINNSVSEGWNVGGGGGISCDNSNPTFEDCIIANNESPSPMGGGGMYLLESSPIIRRTQIINNISADVGGGIYAKLNSFPQIEHSIIAYNTAESFGGGIHLKDTSSATIYATRIYGNTSGESGGGISAGSASSPLLLNTTLYGNTSENRGGGIYCYSGASPFLINSIVWDNTPNALEFTSSTMGDPIVVKIAYSDMINSAENIVTHDNGSVLFLEGNIETDPLFENPPDTLSLTDYSPCINAGTAFYEYQDSTILSLSESEYVGTGPEIGAMERWDLLHFPLSLFDLLAPGDNDTIRALPIDFSWTTSTSGNNSGVEYALHLSTADTTYIYPSLADTLFALGDPDVLQGGASFTWTVVAQDQYVSLSPTDSFAFSIAETVSIERSNKPSKFRLMPVYPNPFNPSTTIPFEIQDRGEVTLLIFNIKARIVMSKSVEYEAPGIYEIQWDGRDELGRDVSAGLYVAELRVKGLSQATKMILLR